MSVDPIATIEYEALILGRHLSGLPGRSRRRGGLIDQSAYTLLAVLHEGGPASIAELGAVTGLDASTLNRQTAALLRDGYAERIADPDGGMARKFRPTAEGDHVLAEEREASKAALAAVITDWSPHDRGTFADLLERFNKAIEARLQREWPRTP
ncbi:MarR family winged helix-turn-helix transcriptional regulator [Microbacterium allomyrinae]|uniref:MarR family transcriptional regulator n=1 Tax=Microbacterium allomyrinae TaxID=2830666 RepID=A0A9X1LTW8_9MICO|nr:MarR family transcriptional regulator [Microbacterium allomyrinae]MCC2032062.1 MarR family transcriptional regulator [Microbacterium allomyrinae]